MPAVTQLITVLFTAGAAAMPMVTPLLASMPAWAHALLSGSIAALGAVYHLYQPAPTA